MSEYYDKNASSGNRPRPPQRKQDDADWGKWVAVIILFSIGLWPIAFLVLFSMFSREKKRKKWQQSVNRRETAQEREAREERVARAIRQAEECIHEIREGIHDTMRETRPTAAQETLHRREAAAQERTSQTRRTTAESAPSAAKKSPKEKKPGRLLRIIGICLLILGAILCIDAVPSLWEGYSNALSDLFSGLGFLAGGAISWGRGEFLAKLSRRTKRYILAIGGADTMPLSEIAKRVNRTPEKAAKELQKLIDGGYLGEDAYIDHEKGYFVRFGATIEEDAPPVSAEVPPEAEEGYSGILRNLRIANDRIPDEALSRKIERLEQISALIFKEVEEHPEKRARIHTFFDYYLPTTQKLLDTYAEFDEMGVEGENMTQAKARIAAMMDSIVEGFEHQLDQLYSTDAMDVASDIKVMETMLNRDSASAARDFGYDTAKTKESAPQQLEL